jgi:hypothetical protein
MMEVAEVLAAVAALECRRQLTAQAALAILHQHHLLKAAMEEPEHPMLAMA